MRLPLSLWDLALWIAFAAIILLITSELLSPYYGRIGLVIEKKNIRRVALILGMLFLASVALQIYGIIMFS